MFRVLGMLILIIYISIGIVAYRIYTKFLDFKIINCLKQDLQDYYLFVIFSQLGKIRKVTRCYFFDKVTILLMRNGMRSLSHLIR